MGPFGNTTTGTKYICTQRQPKPSYSCKLGCISVATLECAPLYPFFLLPLFALKKKKLSNAGNTFITQKGGKGGYLKNKIEAEI